MSDVTAAGRYTRALFELAEKENSLSEMDAGLQAIAEALKTYPKVLLLMPNPTLTDTAKYALVQKLFSIERAYLLERFLRVLIDKKRFALLPEIQKDFHARFEKKQGLLEVEMVSAVPLSSKFTEKLKVFLKNKFRSEIRLLPGTDKRLLGGFVLRFDGKEIDCSFKNRLYEIQQKILSPIEEGIASC